jgi:hypothetical protein
VSTELWRFSAGSWARLPLNLPAPTAQVYALAGGRVRAGVRLASAFSVQEWTGSAWTQRASLPLPTSPAGESFSSLGESAMTFVLQSNSGATHQLWQWDGANVSALPLVPGNPPNRAPILFGASLTSIYAISGNGQTQLHRYDGNAWTPLTSGLAGDTLVAGMMCDGQPVVRGFRGRVYRLAGSSWQRLGTDAEILPNRFFFSAARDISCAADGTLRTIAGDGSLARWDGTRWVVEAFAPSLRATKVVSPALGWATGGAYSVYRWNGSAWSLAYRDHAIFEQRVMGLAAWPDGRFMGALWSSTGPADGTSLASNPQGILRYDGSDWTREVGGALARANAVWGPRYDNAFTVTGDGTILQFNGSAWTERASVGQALFAIDGVGDDHALAIGTDLATWRWNGAAWSQAATGVPGLIGATRLYVPAMNDAWSATNAGLVYHFNGTAWSQVNMSAAGGSTNTWAIFGTGPNDVFVLRGPLAGARRLYRWNGAAWSLVSSFAPGSLDIPQAGSAVPGFGVVVGNRARWWRGGGS